MSKKDTLKTLGVASVAGAFSPVAAGAVIWRAGQADRDAEDEAMEEEAKQVGTSDRKSIKGGYDAWFDSVTTDNEAFDILQTGGAIGVLRGGVEADELSTGVKVAGAAAGLTLIALVGYAIYDVVTS